MTVKERLREWIADPSTNDGEFVSIRPDGVRELLAELTAKDAQIAKLRAERDALLAACKAAREFGSDGTMEDGRSVNTLLRKAIALAEQEPTDAQ